MIRPNTRNGLLLALAVAMPAAALALAPRQAGSEVPITATEASGAYTVDGVHSNAHFKVQHLGAGMFWGRF
ncbi:MAG: hypothetical protein ACO3QA_12790, partial [Phycisphaerales bacterium]